MATKTLAAVELRDEIAPVYAFVASRLGHDRAAAEDVTQETLLSALQGGFDPARGELRAWLIGIALRKIVDHQRRRRPRPAVAQELAVRMCGEPLPGEWIERHEVRGVVNEALARLPAATAALLARKYFDGEPVSVIAARLSMSEKAVESALTRARESFHEAIQRLGYGT